MAESEIPADIMQAAWEAAEHTSIMSLMSQRADIIAEALHAERQATNQRWRDSDEEARAAGFMKSHFDVLEAVFAERERCAMICEKEAAAMQRVADFHRPPRVDYDPALADMHEQGAAVASRLAAAIRQDNPNET